MIFWFQPEFNLDRSGLLDSQIFQNTEKLVKDFMLIFPDS
jgi:hypothetical protein